MICFLRPHLLSFSHRSRWLAQVEGKSNRIRRVCCYHTEASCFLDSLNCGGTRRCMAVSVPVRLCGWVVETRPSASITQTHTFMGTNNLSVMVEWVCVTDRQVRGLVVTWLSTELCQSYLLWPLTSIPPQPLCDFLWCIYINPNAQGNQRGSKLDRVKSYLKKIICFDFLIQWNVCHLQDS